MSFKATIERAVARTILRLPDNIILKMAGGVPIVVDDRKQDVRAQFLGVQSARGPQLATMTPTEARAAMQTGLEMLADKPERGVTITQSSIEGPGGSLPVRLYRPTNIAGQLPGLLYFHMGGCVIGNLDTCHVFCSMLAARGELAVTSVDYRLAPEHSFPAPVEDALAAWRWFTSHGESLGIDTTRLGVGGDSAGGYLSAVLAQQMKATNGPLPQLQLLIYPVVDMTAQGGSLDSCANIQPLTRELMDWFIGHYLNAPDEASDVRASPFKFADKTGLAPAVVITAGFDTLRDQGHAYAEALAEAGVPVTERCYDGLAHGFTAMTGVIPAARTACLEIVDDVRRVLSGAAM
ncbi:MAG: alpha/beta hydrolase [Parvularculales bacterium]